MADYHAKRDPDCCPAHPGELLREVIAASGRSKAEAAVRLGKTFGDGDGASV